ncbi:VOC family protein [Rugosimonospora acidiphila]|uniref:VOC family protein n=1 Tax=Rugosimonospora acidiphila TaxID=556531 RepID=A0ABP9SQ71_9ACTN
MPVARLAAVALDCDDPTTLANFWAQLVGGQEVMRTEDFVVLNTGLGGLAAVRVPDYQPPTWPDGSVPKQMHLDLAVDDLEQAQAEAVRLGARPADVQPVPERYRVMLDPAGHPFCLTTAIPK